ncbi:MAG: class 1 fructose-bisphosphatase [Flavobacteriales bacterium]|nr:class 1 fructose-bisphosphatase [Flavobacteriales bacterium]|tara:strand:+ start:2422 stop:3420 length:999 start_codon:yes stop_codon:yes gene_type:complete
MAKIKTLTEFITDQQALNPSAKGDLSRLLNDIAIASKIVHREINKAGLVDILGEVGQENVQGESVKKLDLYANDQFIAAFKSGGECAAVASEEDEDIVILDGLNSQNGKYLVSIDPLDGSSNIDVNISVGTIFSVLQRKDTNKTVTKEEFFVAGKEQVAAGYVIYGSSTMLVYTTGNGVNGFTLDPSIGEFCLSHPNIQTPVTGEIYSVNEANLNTMSKGVKKYVSFCQQLDDNKNRTHTARFMGSLVADFHRNLLKGGIYIYPKTTAAPLGRLRLLYECAPLAWIAEEAGGKATDGTQRILDIVPTDLHQRTPYFIGSTQMVEKAQSYMNE